MTIFSCRGANLTDLGVACARFPSNKAMWSPVASCIPNVSKVYGEPYCGGATGLYMGADGKEWQFGADYWVAQIRDKMWVVGLWLGDEPEIMGVPYAQICLLTTYLKKALIAAGRSDVFLAYNDGPSSGQMANGMCSGLDYFSLDSYRDDPDQEVAAVKAALAPLMPKLRKPNPMEPRGQGVWVVPGLFWFMGAENSCKDPGGAGSAGSDKPVCSAIDWCPGGQQCDTTPSWLVGKMEKYWAWAQSEPGSE